MLSREPLPPSRNSVPWGAFMPFYTHAPMWKWVEHSEAGMELPSTQLQAHQHVPKTLAGFSSANRVSS